MLLRGGRRMLLPRVPLSIRGEHKGFNLEMGSGSSTLFPVTVGGLNGIWFCNEYLYESSVSLGGSLKCSRFSLPSVLNSCNYTFIANLGLLQQLCWPYKLLLRVILERLDLCGVDARMASLAPYIELSMCI